MIDGGKESPLVVDPVAYLEFPPLGGTLPPQAEIADTPATPCGSLPTRLNGGSSGNGR